MAKGIYIGANSDPAINRNLPAGYIQLEYIESSGTQYINTGVNSDSTKLIVEIDGSFESVASGYIAAAYDGSHYYGLRPESGTSLNWHAGMDNHVFACNYLKVRAKYRFNYGNLYIDDVLAANGNGTSVNRTLYLFARNGESSADRFGHCKIYACKMWADGNLLRDFVPCKNPSNTIGLYDMANGVFYANAGTGTFIEGPEVYEREYTDIARKVKKMYVGVDGVARTMSKGYVGVDGVAREVFSDVEYTKLEYIESTGTQCIDTGISGGTNAKYELIFNPFTTYADSWEHFFGGESYVPKIFRNGNYVRELWFQFVDNTGGGDTGFYFIHENRVFKVLYDGSGIYIDDVFKRNLPCAGNGWGSKTWFVFCGHSDTTREATMRLYGLKMWTNGVLVRDFIPCISPDNVVCLWDDVSKTYFTNIGTGNFVAGPVIN